MALNTDGSFTYTPNPGFNGLDSFTYYANDDGLDSNVATVTLSINGAPVANDDSATTVETVAMDEALLQVQTGLVVYYPLPEGSGSTVQDQSNVGTPMDLTLNGTVSWAIDGNGLVFTDGQEQSSGAATKVMDALQATNQSTILYFVFCRIEFRAGES